MCGLYGYFQKSGSIATTDADAFFRRAGAEVASRGPDDRGEITLGRVRFGHARLAIVDLSPTGRQPIVSPDGEIAVIVNGEIWNHAELVAQVPPGTLPPGRSDARAVLAAYALYGAEFARALDGMFALCLFDRRLDRFVMARDPSGEKPLYVRETATEVRFASTLRSLVPHGEEFDRTSFARFLLHGRSTLHRFHDPAIGSVPPGHSMIFEPGLSRTAQTAPNRFEKGDVGIARLIEMAVKKRSTADVPIGVFLSGGIDSALVLEILTRILGRGVATMTAGFSATEFDERPAARATAEYFGADHQEIEIASPEWEDIVATVRDLGEPLADSSALAFRPLARAARSRFKVAFTGDGGDETFLGYDRYAAVAAASRPAVVHALRLFARFFSGRRRQKIAALTGGDESTPARRLLLLQANAASGWIKKLVGESLFGSVLDEERVRYDEIADKVRCKGVAQTVMMVDRSTLLEEDLLVKSDRLATTAGIETRAAFLDHDLFLAVKDRMAGDPRWPLLFKGSLRRLARGRLPAAVLRRKKKGFGVPLHAWINRPSLAQEVRRRLDSPDSRIAEFVDRDALRSLLASAAENHDMAVEVIYALAVAEIWLDGSANHDAR